MRKPADRMSAWIIAPGIAGATSEPGRSRLLFGEVKGWRAAERSSLRMQVFPVGAPDPKKTLRNLLDESLATNKLLMMPCCFDALSAKLVENAGFPLTFMSGFSTVAAARAIPDTGLMSFGEMTNEVAAITGAVSIPLIADGDTGYGNAINIKRTVRGYIGAGAAGILLEDQVNPKRCGHTRGKAVVSREEAVQRIKAAVDARGETGGAQDFVILARTDAAACISFDEAVERCIAFREAGADITFLEAPRSQEEMREYCGRVPGPKLANMLEQGATPILPASELESMGYTIAAYPLTLMSSAVKAMEEALEALKSDEPNQVQSHLKDFADIRRIVGFDAYYEEEERYRID